jgi:hypothetical protein
MGFGADAGPEGLAAGAPGFGADPDEDADACDEIAAAEAAVEEVGPGADFAAGAESFFASVLSMDLGATAGMGTPFAGYVCQPAD